MNEQKDAAAVRVFPPAVPVLTILLGVGLSRVWSIDLGFELSTPERYWLGGLMVGGAIFGLGLWSILLFRHLV